MARVYRIEFPPGTELISANAREHWSKRAKATAHLRRLAFELAKEAGIPCLNRVRIRAIYYPPDRRRRDAPNVLFHSSKAAIDGIVDYGILADDNDRYVNSLDLLPAKDERGNPVIVKQGQMVIEIEEDE